MRCCLISSVYWCSRAGGEAAKKQLHQSIREQKQKNLALGQLNGELNQELQEVMEQRIALEIQLEHLKPFSYWI